MSINEGLYNSPAVRGDISGTTISTAVALRQIAAALEALQKGTVPTEDQIKDIKERAERLEEIFDRLTGFSNDD